MSLPFLDRSALQRTRARARQRGAIFVEAAIVSTMLMTMLAGGVFFHHMYDAKILAGREARLKAWEEAEKGCPSKLGAGQLMNYITPDSCVDESCTVGGLSAVSEESPNWLAMGAKVGDVTHSATEDEIVGGKAHSFRTINRVVCNESRQDSRGDLKTIGDYILDAVITQ
jgi:hypothetical protein